MKAESLRIGNWVYWKAGNNVKLDVSDFAELVHDPKYLEVAKPIPITPEWLERAGFWWNESEESHDIKIHENLTLGIYDNEITKTWFVQMGHEIDWLDICEIQYIHQLQNLYFALTGKELEFKKI